MTARGATQLLWLGFAGLGVLTLSGRGTTTLLQLTVVALGCIALVPLAGWLRLWSFLPVAAAGAGAIAAAILLGAGQAIPVVLLGATVAGAVVGAAVMAVATGRRDLDSMVSIVAAVAVWGVALPAVAVPASHEVVLFGIDLAGDRALALVALALVAAGAWSILHVGSSRFGREAVMGAADGPTAHRFGIDVRRTRLEAGMLAGGIAGWAGLVLTLDAQTLPASAALAPAIGLLWLGAALLGGCAGVPTALLGAVLVGGVAPALGLPAPAAAGVALMAVAVARGDGLGNLQLVRRGPP